MHKGQYYTRNTASGWRIFQYVFVSPMVAKSKMLLDEPAFVSENKARLRIRQLNKERRAAHGSMDKKDDEQ